MSKSKADHGRVVLVHLRGRAGTGEAPSPVIARLVAGHGGVVEQPADPQLVFAAVVIMDLERTGDLLTSIAREAEAVYTIGCRGFRPRSPVLRRQRDDAVEKAVAEMRAMAMAWRASGLVAAGTLPPWLTAALEDGMSGR